MTGCLSVLGMIPRLKEVVWGSDRLQVLFGKDAPRSQLIGEAWEVSALKGMASAILGDSRTLDQVFAADPVAILGPGQGAEFPLLVKLLSTSKVLSVQVHPSASQAAKLSGTAAGKWEAWLILDAKPDAFVFAGLAEGFGPSDLRAAAGDSEVSAMERVLRRVPVKAGDVIDVHPGCVHAIGPGITLLEVQQPSDTTYRISDWGRMGLDGHPRELHLQDALAVLDASLRPEPITATGDEAHEVLLENAAFRLERLSVDGSVPFDAAGMVVAVAIDGEGSVRAADGASVPLVRGSSCLIPYAANVVTFEGRGLTLALCRPPR